MARSAQRSPEQVDADIRATRANIAETLDEVQQRLTPGQLLDEALGSTRLRATASGIATTVARNPLPVMLIGVGAVWLAIAGNRRARPPEHHARPALGRTMPVNREILMAVSRENLTAWLRDAHAMEHQAIEILEKQASRLEHYPELRARVQSHLAESHRQAERVEHCLHQLGTDTSGLKTAAGKVIGTAQQLSGLFASDEVLKGGIADYAFEHYEIASYKMLISAATEAGEHEVRRTLEENLREEQAMADWLSRHLPEVTRQYLHRAAAGETAKV